MRADVQHTGEIRLTAETGAESALLRIWFPTPREAPQVGPRWHLEHAHGDTPTVATFAIVPPATAVASHAPPIGLEHVRGLRARIATELGYVGHGANTELVARICEHLLRSDICRPEYRTAYCGTASTSPRTT